MLSADTAAAAAAEVGWPPADEQLLYVIHGMLHLVGYRRPIGGRSRGTCGPPKRCYLQEFGVELPAGSSADSTTSMPGAGGTTAW